MPFQLAEHVVTVMLHFTRGHVDPQMISVKFVSNPKTKLTAMEKKDRVDEVVLNVPSHLSSLRRRFHSREGE